MQIHFIKMHPIRYKKLLKAINRTRKGIFYLIKKKGFYSSNERLTVG